MSKIVKLISKIINDRENIKDVAIGNDDDLSFTYKDREFELRANWNGDYGKMVYYLSFYPSKRRDVPVVYSNVQSSLFDYDELLDELYTVIREIGTGANDDIDSMLED